MTHSKQDVRDFLVTRRGKITPDQAGLAHYGANRRVPGLRREEVALLAGVSVDYYTRLEKGNLAGVSDSVLHAVADALHLDDAERSHLVDLARAANASPQRARPAPRSRVRIGLQLVLDGMRDMPAFVANGRMDVLAWNALGDAMYSGRFSADRDAGRVPNFARFNVLDPAAQEFYGDWGKALDTTASMLRTEVGRNPGDKKLSNLVGELSTRSDDFARRWASHDVRIHRAGVKHFLHPEVGELVLHYEVLPVIADDGQVMTVYTAEPQSPTHHALQLLASLYAPSHENLPDATPATTGVGDPEDEHTF